MSGYALDIIDANFSYKGLDIFCDDKDINFLLYSILYIYDSLIDELVEVKITD